MSHKKINKVEYSVLVAFARKVMKYSKDKANKMLSCLNPIDNDVDFELEYLFNDENRKDDFLYYDFGEYNKESREVMKEFCRKNKTTKFKIIL